jgi:hypothetical protein
MARRPAGARSFTFVTVTFTTRHTFAASVGFMAIKAATPWGPATMLDEVKVPQRAGDKRFASVLQLLENERGETLVRFAYSTGGAARRGPVTLRARDLERLRAAAVGDHPALARALGWTGGDA